jgi:predicted RNA binding protein YcfA (HicA-like mRNA interferase family)
MSKLPGTPNKDVRKMLRLVEREGFRFVRYTGTGHYKFEGAEGQTLIIPSTPSGPRWKQNAIAEMRRAKRRKP